MSLELLAKALKIEIKGNGWFDYLLKHYKEEGFGTIIARRKALEDMVVDRIEALVNKIEGKGE